MSSQAAWRPASPADLDAIMAIQAEVHTLLQERREVFADKMRLFGEGSLVLSSPQRLVGYGVAHPWALGQAPPLDARFDALPTQADCLFIHDVALLLPARGQGAGAAFARRMFGIARQRGLPRLALISVYGTVPIWERCGFTVDADRVPADKLAGYGPTARYMTAEIADHE